MSTENSPTLSVAATKAINDLTSDIALRAHKLASEHEISFETVLETLNLTIPPFIHRLRKFKPSAWNIALSQMANEAPPDMKKSPGKRGFDGSYAKWVSQNWKDRKKEFEDIAKNTDTLFRMASEREGSRGLVHDLRRACSYASQGDMEVLCFAVSQNGKTELTYASSETVQGYLGLMESKGVGSRKFKVYIEGNRLVEEVKKAEEVKNNRSNACIERNKRRTRVTSLLLKRLNACAPPESQLSKLPRQKGSIRKWATGNSINFRLPSTWQSMGLDELESMLQSSLDGDLRKVEQALTAEVIEDSLRFISMHGA